MDKYSAVYFVKTNEVLVIGDLTTHLCSCSSTGACGAAWDFVWFGGCDCSSAAGISWHRRKKLGFSGKNEKGQHCLGNEWLVTPAAALESLQQLTGAVVSAPKLPLVGATSDLCAWASVLRARPTPQWVPPAWVGFPAFHVAMTMLPLAKLWSCSRLLLGSWELHGAQGVPQCPPGSWGCRSLSILLQILSPAQTSVIWKCTKICGGQWCPREGRGKQHCQCQQTLSSWSFSAASSAKD